MKDQELTPDMVPVIKLAREKGYNYALIAAHYKINQGRHRAGQREGKAFDLSAG